MNRRDKYSKGQIRAAQALVIIWFATAAALIGAWLTHIFVCLQNDQWGFLIAGALLPPIGMIHGLGIWLGVF